MVPRMRDDVHPPVAVPRFTQVLDRLRAALRVHPVLIAVYRASVYQDQSNKPKSRLEVRKDVQTKVTGILSAAMRSTSGMRACAPGARMCAKAGDQRVKQRGQWGPAHICSTRPSPWRG